MSITPRDVLDFWLGLGEKQYWTRDDRLDGEIKARFGAALAQARAGALDHWTATAEGALALVILLDQTSRNIHRGTPDAFAADAQALNVAKEAVARGFDAVFDDRVRRWFYLPYMHSENLPDQETCVSLLEGGDQGSYKAALEHRDIISRFGRFPHRNLVLGRDTTTAERAFLDDGGFSG